MLPWSLPSWSRGFVHSFTVKYELRSNLIGDNKYNAEHWTFAALVEGPEVISQSFSSPHMAKTSRQTLAKTLRPTNTSQQLFFRDDYTQLEVLLGLDKFDDLSNVQRREISDVVIHENFTSTSVRDENDIAIATLDKVVPFGDTIIPVCLPKPGKKLFFRHSTYLMQILFL